MDADTISTVATWLQATSPYGVLAVLGWAYWRKDGDIKTLAKELIRLTERQIAAVDRVDSTLKKLCSEMKEKHQ